MEASVCGMLMLLARSMAFFAQAVSSAGVAHSSAWLMLTFPCVSAATQHSWKPALNTLHCFNAFTDMSVVCSDTLRANYLFTPNWIKTLVRWKLSLIHVLFPKLSPEKQ